jgi:xanthine dehydrogenase iron-sulfur cluster and FAD-binding subunit A
MAITDRRRFHLLQGLADDAGEVVVSQGDSFFAIPRSEAALARLALDHPGATLLAGGGLLGSGVLIAVQAICEIFGDN